VAEWSIAPVLKTGGSKGPVSSNLTASAKSIGFVGLPSLLMWNYHICYHSSLKQKPNPSNLDLAFFF
jgi:hypothetical protein